MTCGRMRACLRRGPLMNRLLPPKTLTKLEVREQSHRSPWRRAAPESHGGDPPFQLAPTGNPSSRCHLEDGSARRLPVRPPALAITASSCGDRQLLRRVQGEPPRRCWGGARAISSQPAERRCHAGAGRRAAGRAFARSAVDPLRLASQPATSTIGREARWAARDRRATAGARAGEARPPAHRAAPGAVVLCASTPRLHDRGPPPRGQPPAGESPAGRVQGGALVSSSWDGEHSHSKEATSSGV